MALFGRKSADTQVSPEIEELYRAERRERLGVAWLLGLGTLIATVLLAAGLFFGGRWVWRKLGNVGEKNPTQTANQQQNQPNNPSPAPASPTPEPTPQPTPQPTPAPTPEPTPAPTPTPTPTTPAPTPTPGPVAAAPAPTPAPLPHTGPADTLAIFVAVTVLGAFGHNVATRKKPG